MFSPLSYWWFKIYLWSTSLFLMVALSSEYQCQNSELVMIWQIYQEDRRSHKLIHRTTININYCGDFSAGVGLMLARRLRRRPKIIPALAGGDFSCPGHLFWRGRRIVKSSMNGVRILEHCELLR